MKKCILVTLSLTLLLMTRAPLKAVDVWDPEATLMPGQPATTAIGSRIAFDNAGNALAYWTQSDGTYQRIYYNFYDGTTWLTTSTTIPGLPNYNTAEAHPFAFDNTGNAFPLWVQYNETGSRQIYYAIYDGTTWQTTATAIPEQPATDAFRPQLAFDNENNALFVWHQLVGSTRQIFYACYNASTLDWSATATTIPDQPFTPGYSAQVAFDANNKALVTWVQNDGSYNQIYYARYDTDTFSWSTTATTLPGQPATNAVPSSNQMAFDNVGKIFTIWVQSNGSYNQLYYASYDGSSWTVPTIIPGQLTTPVNFQKIAFDKDGNGLTVWNQNDGVNNQLYYSYYDGTSWSTATTISGAPATDAYSVNLTFDQSNNAIVVWDQNDGSVDQVYYARYDGTSWVTTATKIPGQPAGSDGGPEISSDSFGNTIAIWPQVNNDIGTFQIYYARYQNLIAPTISIGTQELHRFPTQADLINVLQWSHNAASTITRYYIYCKPYGSTGDYTRVGEISASSLPLFYHHSRCFGQRATYIVTSVDASGNESTPSEAVTIPAL